MCRDGCPLFGKFTDSWDWYMGAPVKVRIGFPKRWWHIIQRYLLVYQLFLNRSFSLRQKWVPFDFSSLCDYPFRKLTAETVGCPRRRNICTNMRRGRCCETSIRLKVSVNNKVKLNSMTLYVNSICLFVIRYEIFK